MRWYLAPLALGFTASADAADAPDTPPAKFQVALAAGSGIAYGTLGAHAEIILFDHFAPYLGLGTDLNSLGLALTTSFAGGLRLFLGQGAGAMLSLNYASGNAGEQYNTYEGWHVDDEFWGASLVGGSWARAAFSWRSRAARRS